MRTRGYIPLVDFAEMAGAEARLGQERPISGSGRVGQRKGYKSSSARARATASMRFVASSLRQRL
jgi:hypothetical protein